MQLSHVCDSHPFFCYNYICSHCFGYLWTSAAHVAPQFLLEIFSFWDSQLLYSFLCTLNDLIINMPCPVYQRVQAEELSLSGVQHANFRYSPSRFLDCAWAWCHHVACSLGGSLSGTVQSICNQMLISILCVSANATELDQLISHTVMLCLFIAHLHCIDCQVCCCSVPFGSYKIQCHAPHCISHAVMGCVCVWDMLCCSAAGTYVSTNAEAPAPVPPPTEESPSALTSEAPPSEGSGGGT